MTDSIKSQSEPLSQAAAEPAAISIVQRGNLKNLEQTLRKQWRLGQRIVLCWSPDERGTLVIFVPHYFLGNYCAVDGLHGDNSSDNEVFIRELISGKRRRSRDELFTPDSSRIIYFGDQEIHGTPALYSVLVDGGPTRRVSPYLPSSATSFTEFRVSPDSRYVVHVTVPEGTGTLNS